MPSGGIAFRPDIQGLRAIAVALVILAHARVSGFAGGFVGVDVFFVLSGYLITGLLVEERLATGAVRYGRFLARRLRRLLPAMLAMLVLVLLVASLLLSAYEMRMQSRSFPYAVAWISNFFFSFGERDYFSALQAEDLYLHTWSLGVEEQFYLVWPWLLLLLFGIRSRSGGATSLRNNVLGGMTTLFVASLLLCLTLSAKLPVLSFYMMPARGWQFALGALVYVGFHLSAENGERPRTPAVSGTAIKLLGFAGFLLILSSGMLLDSNINYPGYYALFPSFGAAMVIAAGKLSANHGVARLLGSRSLVWVGDRSYSLYLWHWPVLILGNSMGVTRSPAGVLSLVSISVVLAAISYRFIEYPFWKGSLSKSAPLRVVAYSTVAVVASLAASQVLELNVYGLTNGTRQEQGYDPRYDSPKSVYRSGSDCDTAHHSAELVPCEVKSGSGEAVAVLLGDSVGAQWSPMVAGLFADPEWQVTVLTKSACAIVDHTYYYDQVGADYEVCTDWRNAAIQYLAETRPDVVIIGNSAYYEFTEAEWVTGSSRIFEQLSSIAGHVIVIPGTPGISFDGPSCLDDPYRFSYRLTDGERECEEPRLGTTTDEVTAYLVQAATGLSNVAVLDLGDLVCPQQRCAARTVGGIAVYRDKLHLTVSFVHSLLPTVQGRLQTIGVIDLPD